MPVSSIPTADLTLRAGSDSRVRALRLANAAELPGLRLAAACAALEGCGLYGDARALRATCGHYANEAAVALSTARTNVQVLRVRLSGGSDDQVYAATGAALLALGALWACS